MAVSLKHGLVLDDITVKAGRTPAARLVKTPDIAPRPDGRKGRLILDSCDLPPDFDPRNPRVDLAFVLSATIKASRFTSEQLRENKVRIIQFVRFNTITQTYRGRKPSDGVVIVQSISPLSSQWLLDCATDKMGTVSVGAPFCDPPPTPPRANQYFVKLTDGPALISSLDFHNRKTDRWNYLQNVEYDALFVTGVVFVHKSGEIEPLTGVQWRLTMEADVAWAGGFPMVTPTRFSLESEEPKALDPAHPLFHQFSHPPPGDGCAGILLNRALSNILTDPGISIREADEDLSPVDHFWL